jgi:hypothetical protein
VQPLLEVDDMILKTIKTANETGISGIEFVMTDKAITEIIIGKLHIRKGESYAKALDVLIEAPFDQETRWKLTGTLNGFPDAVTYHTTKYDADAAGACIEDVGGAISVKQVEVLIDELGAVNSEIDAKSNVADVPF